MTQQIRNHRCFGQTRVGDRQSNTDDVTCHGGVDLIDLRRVIITGILDLKLQTSYSSRSLCSVDDRHKEAVAGRTLNLEQDRLSANVGTTSDTATTSSAANSSAASRTAATTGRQQYDEDDAECTHYGP